MTAPRRALPPRPTVLQRLAAHLTSTGRDEALLSALEDHADRLDTYARRADRLGHHWVASTHRRNAGDLRRILQEHA